MTIKRLTPADKQCIRSRYLEGERQRDLASAFGVHVATIRKLVQGLRAQRRRPDDATRFWATVDRNVGPQACWIWRGMCNRGRGWFRIGKHHAHAHRVAYEFLYGPLPPGAVLLHECGNRRCVNPDHLVLETEPLIPPPQRGEAHRQAKLTDAQVREIRQRYADGECNKAALARDYQVQDTTIGKLVRGLLRVEAGGPITSRLARTPRVRMHSWRPALLAALRGGASLAQACAEADITEAVAHQARRHDPDFAAAWDTARKDAATRWQQPFLQALRQGLSVTEAAQKAGISPTCAYETRVRDINFATAWADAQRNASARQASPPWLEPLLQALEAGQGLQSAAKTAGVGYKQVLRARRQDERIATAIAAVWRGTPERQKAQLLTALQAGQPLREACRQAYISIETARRMRATDAVFATAWDAALQPVDEQPAATTAAPEPKLLEQYYAGQAYQSDWPALSAVAPRPVHPPVRESLWGLHHIRMTLATLLLPLESLLISTLTSLGGTEIQHWRGETLPEKVDLIVADRAGLARMRALKQRRELPPIVLIVDPLTEEPCREDMLGGVFGVVALPLRREALGAAITIALARWREQAALLARHHGHYYGHRPVLNGKH